jgi:hypothetical protein
MRGPQDKDDHLMGGLYNLVMGDGHEMERGAMLLRILGIDNPGRFRDAWVETSDNGPVIAVYTRIGGGNREGYAEFIERNQANPHYIRDADDDFDSTYATFYFRTPDEWVESLSQVAQDPVDMSARWKTAIDSLGGDS